jgi:enoyl-CoA hydratase/carnithine racemase
MSIDAAGAESRASFSQEGSTVWLTMTRPEKANALDRKMVERLHLLLDQAEASPSARALVIGGSGKNFCAGADLAQLRDGGAEGLRQFLGLFQEFTLRLEQSHLLTVAAVHGAARAGGLELALACDMVVACRSATFGDAHLANGILPGGGATARLPRCIGWNRAKWMILSAEPIAAEVAREWGLVLEVVNDADLRGAASRLAESYVRADPVVIRRVKGLLGMTREQGLQASLAAEVTTLEAHYHSHTMRQGLEKLLQRGRRES